MAEYGLQVTNASSQIQIDSTYRNYSLVKQDFAYSKDSGNWPYLVATFPTQTTTPIITFRPTFSEPTALVGITATQAHFVASKNLNSNVQFQVWQRGIVTPATWGMNINNASGNTVFSTEDKHFTITTVITGTFSAVGGYPAKAHALASGPRDFMIVDKAGVEQQVGDGTPYHGQFIYRGYSWPRSDGSASYLKVDSRTSEDLLGWYQIPVGGLSDTMQATYNIVGVRDTRFGRYRLWGGGLAIFGDSPFFYRGDVVFDRIATKTFLWGDSVGNLEVAVWKENTEGTELGNIQGVTHCTSSTLLAAQNTHQFDSAISHIYRSTDRGIGWTKLDLTGKVGEHYLTTIEGLSATLAIAGTRRTGIPWGNATPAIFRSTDSGQNWSRVATYASPSFSDGIYWMEVENKENGVIWAGDQFGLGPLKKSNDFGQTWNKVGTTFVGPVAVNPLNASIMIGIKVGARVVRSTDGGQNWEQVARFSNATTAIHPQTQVSTVGFADATHALVFTTPNAQIWRSRDAGLTFPDLIEDLSYQVWHSRMTRPKQFYRWPDNIATKQLYISGDNGTLWWNSLDNY
jgi:hypothetical protein